MKIYKASKKIISLTVIDDPKPNLIDSQHCQLTRVTKVSRKLLSLPISLSRLFFFQILSHNLISVAMVSIIN